MRIDESRKIVDKPQPAVTTVAAVPSLPSMLIWVGRQLEYFIWVLWQSPTAVPVPPTFQTVDRLTAWQRELWQHTPVEACLLSTPIECELAGRHVDSSHAGSARVSCDTFHS